MPIVVSSGSHFSPVKGAGADAYGNSSDDLERVHDGGVVRPLKVQGEAAVDSHPEYQDIDYWSALMGAARYGHTKIVELLLNTGKSLPGNHTDLGDTALMFAARFGYAQIVKLLLDTGQSSPEYKNEDGETALDIAKQNVYFGDDEIIKLIEEYKPIEAKYARKRK